MNQLDLPIEENFEKKVFDLEFKEFSVMFHTFTKNNVFSYVKDPSSYSKDFCTAIGKIKLKNKIKVI